MSLTSLTAPRKKRRPLIGESRIHKNEYQKLYAKINIKHILEYQKSYALKNPEKLRVIRKRYYEKNREEILAKSKIYKKTHVVPPLQDREKRLAYYRKRNAKYKEGRRLCVIKKKYGLSKIDYEQLMKNQGGVCLICKDPTWKGKSPHIDHDHKTGKIRGILCHHCNITLGMIGENPQVARSIAIYLEKHISDLE